VSLLEPLEQPIFSIGDWFCEVAGESPLSGVALTPQTAEPRIRPTVRGSSAFFIIMSPLERETLIGRLRSIPKDQKEKQMRGGLIEIGTIGVSG
jgi:hypothetical protein